MRRAARSGFSLVELTISTAIAAVAVTMAVTGLVYVFRGANQRRAQNELDIDVQTSMESIKRDLRLSAIEYMFFCPAGAGPCTAISFPGVRADRPVQIDENGKIIWEKQVIYHVWPSSPNELRVTTFSPRDNTLTDAERQEQVDSVVMYGHGRSTYNGDNADSQTVFANLFEWSVKPKGSVFDAYSDVEGRDINVSLGSCLMGPGAHKFEFKVTGKNPDSNGYQIGIDSLFVSPCAGRREAEAQLPPVDQDGALAAAEYMAEGSWDGNHQLLFPARGVGAWFKLQMDNDRWEESNFRATGDLYEDTTVIFDQDSIPKDFLVCLEGNDTNWTAAAQTGDTVPDSTEPNEISGCAVRVLLRGEEMVDGNRLQFDGGKCSLTFRAGSAAGEHLGILAAYIGECADPAQGGMDVVPGTQRRLSFTTGQAGGALGGTAVTTELADYPIDREKSYLVTFLLPSVPGSGTAARWTESISTNQVGSYLIPAASSPTDADAAQESWSARGDVRSTNHVIGVESMFTTYPLTGHYISSVIDTHLAAPAYSHVDWGEDVPGDSTMVMRLRTSDEPDMTNAPAWDTIAPMVPPVTINPGRRRYFQVRADMTPSSDGSQTPRLLEWTVMWDGETRVVDVGGTFTKGPDYGTFELRVDDKLLTTGIGLDLEIYKDVRGYKGERRITSQLSAEVQPRNTGR